MDWMRENVKTIVIVALVAMGVPYLLALLGIIRF